MALDFPANPINGQAYGSYIYNSAVGAWQSKEDPATVAVTATTAPSSANNGDIWYNTNTGVSYVYYADGTSAQWVEIVTSAIPSLDLKANVASPTFTGVVTSPRFTSTQATGTAPFIVASTTAVTNLNADLLDGQHGSVYSPSGMISQFAGATAPTGWLLCDGSAVSRTTFASLFSTIGTTYGVGDNSTTFNLPNLQNRVPVGKGSESEFDTLGEVGGDKVVTLDTTQIPSHTHTTPSHSHSFSATTSSDGNHSHAPAGGSTDGFVAHLTALDGSQTAGIPTSITGYVVATRNTNTAGAHTHTISGTTGNASPTTNASGGGLAHNNLQPYIVLNYIIKT
jgi:microcystin-dependent protein